MKFTDYILKDAIVPVLKATDKEGVIREMVQSLVDAGGIKKEDYEAIVKRLIKREELGTTAIGRGIAMPETKHPSEKRTVTTLAVSAEGIDFDSIDGEKTHLFFMTITSPDSPGDHLRVLEYVVRRLKDDTLCCLLKQAKTREEILALFEESDRTEENKKQEEMSEQFLSNRMSNRNREKFGRQNND